MQLEIEYLLTQSCVKPRSLAMLGLITRVRYPCCISFFYYCYINYHIFIYLNQHPFISSWRSEVQHHVAGFFAQGFSRVKWRFIWSVFCLDALGRIHFQNHFPGRVQFFVVVGLRSSFFGWLSCWRQLMISRSYLHSLSCGPLSLQTCNENYSCIKSPLYLGSLTSLYDGEHFLYLKSSCD